MSRYGTHFFFFFFAPERVMQLLNGVALESEAVSSSKICLRVKIIKSSNFDHPTKLSCYLKLYIVYTIYPK